MPVPHALFHARDRLAIHGWKLRQKCLLPQRKRAFPASARRRLLLISCPNKISQSQIFPFHFHAAALREQWGLALIEISLDTWLHQPELAPDAADTVLFQGWLEHSSAQLADIARDLRTRYPSARLGFLDSFAPTDLRHAQALDERVDVYVKKHVLRDRSQYDRPTRGDTNLTDWFGKRYGLDLPERHFPIPAGFWRKLLIGPTFLTADYLLLPLHHGTPLQPDSARHIDLHARIGGAGTDSWYERMRTESLEAVRRLPATLRISPSGPIGRWAYLQEMRSSLMCFSPFGYGEVCYRDYEAVASGTLLIKPDMAHIETAPDLFLPEQTYVPVAWDNQDLADKVGFYARNPAARQRIVAQAYELARDYATHPARFMAQMRPLLMP